MKVLGVNGSPKKNDNTAVLIKRALDEVEKEGIETQLIHLGDYEIEDCLGCGGCIDSFKCIIKDDMQKLYPLIITSDALILGSPTRFYNISRDMHVFIDRCFCHASFPLRDRSGFVGIHESLGYKYNLLIGVSDQDDIGYTIEVMKLLYDNGYRTVDTIAVTGVKEDSVIHNQEILMRAEKAGKKLATVLKNRKSMQDLLNIELPQIMGNSN